MDRSLALALQPDPERWTWPHFLDDVAARHGDRIALRFQPDADAPWQALSYTALRVAARDLARGLIGAGVVKGARVAVWMPNRPDWAIASFAIALAGGVCVPLNTYATASERDYILRHSDASLLLMQSGLLRHDFLGDLLRDHAAIAGGVPGRLRCAALPHLRRIVCLDIPQPRGGVEPWTVLAAAAEDVDDALLDAAIAEVAPSDDGLLIYTSGTTAHPKGVLHMQRAAVIQSWRFAELMALGPDDLVLSAQPFFWTAGIAMSLGASLAAGASLIVEPVFDPERFLSLVESERVSALHAWPHQEKAMAEHPSARARDLSSLEKIEYGSPLAPLAGLAADEWGTYGSYGLSETFTLASALPASAPADLRKGTSGRPLPGMQVRIVDPDTGAPLDAPRAKGEIAVRGATFMRGYHKVAPELYLDERGLFHTQDGGSFDAEGYLHWSGRLSNLIKTGGANVSPLEIEAALAGRADVHLAQAVGVPHPALGEVIVLCVVAAPGAAPEEAALRDHLRERIAAYKVPRRVLFFAPDELAYTANQKVQVGPLRELALARLTDEKAEIEGHRFG
jgi:acyl-CoA synthetase (AMP-forming)/AMP-acid ligase II